jgi:acetylornithine deacetylase/succinyl-diaminopimelate desuccinylase-like protein
VPLTPIPDGVRSVQSRVDWDAAGAEATEVLAAYLRVDTRNPPGNEAAGADFLAAELAEDGIPSERIELAPGRESLVARLPGRQDAPPLCLLSHIDVVNADPARWSHGPFSGEVDAEGRIWGRGALDMKGPAVAQLQALRWLKRLEVPLARDVVLVAVADEESHNGGMKQLVDQWDRVGCSHVINEGGLGLRDVFFDGQTVFGISVAEKGNLWVRVILRGEGGHGSVTTPDRAPPRLRVALDRVLDRRAPPEVHPALYETLAAVGIE